MGARMIPSAPDYARRTYLNELSLSFVVLKRQPALIPLYSHPKPISELPLDEIMMSSASSWARWKLPFANSNRRI